MFATCGKPKLSESNLDHLRQLGQAIHAGHQPLVFDGGFVSLVEQRESEVNKNVKPRTRNRSAPRQGQGQRKPRRPRSSGKAKPFRTGATEEAHGVGFRLLAQHYEALASEQQRGLWVAVKAYPLGSRGPQAHFLVGIANDSSVMPRAWAFQEIGERVSPFPLKHTNFPDASICAFTQASKAWIWEDGLLSLVDHYSLWAVKSWHRQITGWWPGRQVGVCGFYRRKEFAPSEWCGCESDKLYSDCHMAADTMLDERFARIEFQRLFRVDYDNRAVPADVLRAAKSRWQFVPDLTSLVV